MAGHAQLKFVMTECSKTQIRLTGLILYNKLLLLNFEWKFNRNFYADIAVKSVLYFFFFLLIIFA